MMNNWIARPVTHNCERRWALDGATTVDVGLEHSLTSAMTPVGLIAEEVMTETIKIWPGVLPLT